MHTTIQRNVNHKVSGWKSILGLKVRFDRFFFANVHIVFEITLANDVWYIINYYWHHLTK